MVSVLLMMLSHMGEFRSAAIQKYWKNCSNSMVKKKKMPEASSVFCGGQQRQKTRG